MSLKTVGPLALGFGISSSAVAAVALLAGRQIGFRYSEASRMAAASVAAATIAMTAYRRPTVFGPFISRQTPRLLKERRGGVVIWGLDTGLMVTTVRVTYLTWAALVLSVLGFASWASVWAYALGFVVPLVVMVVFVRPRFGREPDWLPNAIYLRRSALRLLGVVAIGVVAAAFGVAAVADDNDRLRLVSFLCRTLLISVWLSAATAKALQFARLVATITRLNIPKPRASARFLIVSELVAGLGLATTALDRMSIVLSELLFLGFLLVGVVSLRRKETVECSCFGGETAILGWKQIIQFPVVTTLSVVGWVGTSTATPRSALMALATGSIVVIVASAASLTKDWERLRQERLYLQDDLSTYDHQSQASPPDAERPTWSY